MLPGDEVAFFGFDALADAPPQCPRLPMGSKWGLGFRGLGFRGLGFRSKWYSGLFFAVRARGFSFVKGSGARLWAHCFGLQFTTWQTPAEESSDSMPSRLWVEGSGEKPRLLLDKLLHYRCKGLEHVVVFIDERS